MDSRFSGILATLSRRRQVLVLERLSSFFRSLSPSDKLLTLVLGGVLIVSCLVGIIALERTFLVEVPRHGGSLTEGVVGPPRFINPLLALTDSDRDLVALTYAGLMGVGPGGLHPVLAESYTISEDGKEYTFVLKEGLKFSDGTPVTAQDVVFTVTKAQDPSLKSPELANWANIRAEAVDSRTVVFTLPKAYAPFLEDTTLGILPSHLWKNIPNEQFPFSELMTNPVGAGPFQVTKITKDSDNMITDFEVKAFKQYALGKPYLNSMHFVFFVTTDELENAYAHGKVESAYGVPSDTSITAPYSRVFGIFLNPEQNKLFARIEVRKALSLAINRTHITKDLLGGYATPLAGPVPPGAGVSEPVPLDGDNVAAAKKVLTDNGWAYDEVAGVWKNAKQKLTLGPLVITTSNVPELKTLAASVQDDWQALGVATSLEFHEPSALPNEVIRPRKYEALFFGMVIGRNQDLFAFWDSSQRQDPGLNIALYANRSVDQLLEKNRQESDETKRLASLQKISDEITSDYGALFTHAPDFVYAVPQDLGGVVLPQITSPADRFATVSSWHRRTEWVLPFFAR
ncbi:MAG: peptide ABC transporter substrate-binding protein [Patescibacteria group bacterium]